MTGTPATAFERATALERLADEEFDVLVIGGGITGAGVLLEAASRGLRAALVEKDDFASGTSSKSSKLVHGGLRYLQQREFALVHENLVERQRLLKNAPHLVEPLPFLVPLFGSGGVVDQAVVRAYRVALSMYDVAGGWRIGKRHRKITAQELSSHFPTMRLDRLVAGFLYYDAQADDARLTLAITRTAVLAHGAVAANHARVTRLELGADGRLAGALVEPEGQEPIKVRAKAVVNATGVWADQVQQLEDEAARETIRPAKGIHLTVRQEAIPCDMAAVLPVPGDKRSIFVVPWGGHTYVGTTDTDYRGDLDSPDVSAEDVDYVIAAVNSAVSQPISRADVTGAWAGLRPLLAAAPGRRRAPSARTADLSRRHRVTLSGTGLVTITGGKLTTYRKMAEDTVDALTPRLGRLRPSPTKHLRLRGADGLDSFDRLHGEKSSPGPGVISHLRRRYGGEARAVLSLMGERDDLAEPLVEGLPYLAAEAVYAARYEMATTLEDVLARRTRAVLLEAEATSRAAPQVADLLAGELGWDEARKKEETAAFELFVAAELGALRQSRAE